MAGNLSIKHAHNEFPSDMFLILETVGAVMTYTDALGRKNLESAVAPFLDVDMSKKVLLNVKLRKLNPNIYVFRSYKVYLQPSMVSQFFCHNFVTFLDNASGPKCPCLRKCRILVSVQF